MSNTEFDVVIAAYSIQDRATEDFDRLVDLVENNELEVEGVVLVRKDFDGSTSASAARWKPAPCCGRSTRSSR